MLAEARLVVSSFSYPTSISGEKYKFSNCSKEVPILAVRSDVLYPDVDALSTLVLAIEVNKELSE